MAPKKGAKSNAYFAASSSTIRPLEFSSDGRYLAYCGPDGRLKIWDSSTGILKQEYTPSSHLSAMCTCLAWNSHIEESTKKKAKRQKSSAVSDATEHLELLALGTLRGTILLYSVTKGDLQSEMTGSHSNAINGICWNTINDTLFSCSEDGYIGEWSISKGNMKFQWKADVGSVSSLAILPNGNSLLSAGKTIKWWDLETTTVLKKFSGHISRVIKLRVVSFPNEPADSGYFVSAASGDRLISVWQFNSSNKSALASFSLTDDPVAINVSTMTSRNEKITLAALTMGGVLHLFEHQLNGKCRKPLNPTVTLQIGSTDDVETSRPVPILSAKVNGCGDNKEVLFAYGDFVKVGFEKMMRESLGENMCLVRDLNSVVSGEQVNSTTVITPSVPNDVKVLAHGHLVSSRPTQMETSSPQKRKLKDENKVQTQRQLPIEDRLGALALEVPKRLNEDLKLSLDNVANLFIQGLHGKDEKILSRVFDITDEKIIDKTVKRIPVEFIMSILKEIHQRIQDKPDRCLPQLSWARAIMTHHFSYLSSCSTLETVLGPLYQLFDSQIILFEKMSRLKGRLELVMTQLDTRNETSTSSSKALCVYQDVSSDEADSYIDELLPSHSESEADNWDEFSEPEDMDLHDNAIYENEDEDGSDSD